VRCAVMKEKSHLLVWMLSGVCALTALDFMQGAKAATETIPDSYLLTDIPSWLRGYVGLGNVTIVREKGGRSYRVPQGSAAALALDKNNGELDLARAFPSGRNAWNLPVVRFHTNPAYPLDLSESGVTKLMGSDLVDTLVKQGLIKDYKLLKDLVFFAVKFAKTGSGYEVIGWAPSPVITQFTEQ
jgi:hypothetical protein